MKIPLTDASDDNFNRPNDLENEVNMPMQCIFGYESEEELYYSNSFVCNFILYHKTLE